MPADIYEVLKDLQIPYTRYDHPAFYTCEEADAFYQDIAQTGGTCMNLLM